MAKAVNKPQEEESLEKKLTTHKNGRKELKEIISWGVTGLLKNAWINYVIKERMSIKMIVSQAGRLFL